MNAREAVDYYDSRCTRSAKLYPKDDKARAEASGLFDFFFDKFGVAVRAWAYAYMLPLRAPTICSWSGRAPFWERICLSIIYPLLASQVRQSLALQPNTIPDQEVVIEKALAQVDSRLSDGRRFLMGDSFTAPDLALAALAAPMLLPTQYAGPLPTLDELPSAMRASVEHWQTRPAGQFVLRIYQENRPRRTPDLNAEGVHASGSTWKDKLGNFIVSPGVLRPVFAAFRRFCPICILGKSAIITRYDDVVEVLKRDRDFTIREINEAKINAIDGPFILGMDASPEYDRENAFLHQVIQREDLDKVRQFVVQAAAGLIEAARPRGRIDVVNGFARVVPVRLVAEYFGMPCPNDPTMMRWMRDIFHYIFANLTGDSSVLRDALLARAELRSYMDAQIALRKTQRARFGASRDLARCDSGHNGASDVLGRMLALQGHANPWLDDNAVRRNLGGVIVGAVDTTATFVTLAIDQLLRWPKPFADARDAALAGDVEAVGRYAWEAVRFNPHHPLQVRYCPRETKVAEGQSRSKTVSAGSSVFVGTLSAMFDPTVFTNPREFDANRNVEYLHFGYGMHACFGTHINRVQIPELLAARLRLPRLRRASGRAGQILYEGPFPNRLVLQFDS